MSERLIKVAEIQKQKKTVKHSPQAHRKFKIQQQQRLLQGHARGAAPPIFHPGCSRFRGANVQRCDPAAIADAPKHFLRGRNDDPQRADRPGHGPQLFDPRAQRIRQPAGQPDEPAQHHAEPAGRGLAGVIGREVATLYIQNAYLKKLNSSYSYYYSTTNFTQSPVGRGP